MVGELRVVDDEIVQLYARALLAIARADDEIDPDEGVRLEQRIEARSGRPVSLDALLLSDPLDPGELVEQLRRLSGGPFRRAGIHPAELAAVIVTDGIAVVLAKGHVAESEAHELWRFAAALGCTREDLRRMSDHLAPWMAVI